MAKRTKLKEIPGPRGGTKYPWKDWLDGSVWEITLDDVPTESSLRNGAALAAKRAGKRVSIRKTGDVFLLQATDRDD